MPVTIKPSDHGANEYKPQHGAGPVPTTREFITILAHESSKYDHKTKGKDESDVKEVHQISSDGIIQSSFENISSDSNIYSFRTGLPSAVLKAYSEHQHLEIRPDDIWLSILTQLNLYVNANAEELRDMFVAHEGQKELHMIDLNDLKGKAAFGIDWGKFSYKMTSMLADNIKDPSLREWMLPTFTTTMKTDQAVAAILMMSTLQKYFKYSASAMVCGLPSVTLLGHKSDWEKLVTKAERLVTFGEEPKVWYGLLKPVLDNFVGSFDAPNAPKTRDFWRKIASKTGGSGVTYLNVSYWPLSISKQYVLIVNIRDG
jgi:hypothetical protein